MQETKVIAAFVQSRKAWELSAQIYQDAGSAPLSPVSALLLKLIGEYYGADPKADRCDVDILASRVEREVQSNKLAQAVVQALRALPTDVSAINVGKELLLLRKDHIGKRLASLLAAGKSGSEVDDLIRQYDAVGSLDGDSRTGEPGGAEILVGQSVSELLAKSFSKDNLIRLWPKSLNDHIDGGVKPGHHILVFAPTEMGKTLFVINAVYGFLQQNLTVLYIGNEDPAADLLMRIINRLTGMNKYQVQENPDEAQKILDTKGYKNLVMAPLAPGNFRTIRDLVKKYNPAVVVLDQLRNIDVDSENRTQALEKAATEARNLAKSESVVVLSVTQAADSASGKTVLKRGDVDSSNIGIPGQIDLMIGIGATDEMEQMNMRMLSFAKNKLSGKHTPIPVMIDPLLSKVLDAANDSTFELERKRA